MPCAGQSAQAPAEENIVGNGKEKEQANKFCRDSQSASQCGEVIIFPELQIVTVQKEEDKHYK